MAQGFQNYRPRSVIVRNSHAYKFLLLQNGKEYIGDIYSTHNSSALPLQGIEDERGNYACHWNNSLKQARFKNFRVSFMDETDGKNADEVTESDYQGSTRDG